MEKEPIERNARRGRRPRPSLKSRSSITAVAWLLAVVQVVNAVEMTGYSKPQVLSFLRDVARENVSQSCAIGLTRIKAYLNDGNTPAARRHHYTEAFSIGVASQFLKRDLDRWMFNGLKCLKSAGETSLIPSQHPMHYCFGFNYDDPRTAYGICIPSACAEDGPTIVEKWQRKVSQNTDRQSLDYGDCVASRYKKQWYERTVPLLHFGLDAVLMTIIALATLYHMKRGYSFKSLASQLFLAFSAKRNVQKIFQWPNDANSTITCIFGLRFLAMAWTVVGHCFLFVQAFIENIDDFKNELVDNFWNQWITNFTLSVDVFFTLSGCLTAFIWFRKWQNNTTEIEPSWMSVGYWLRFYRHRLIRLWPAYIYTLVAITMRIEGTHYHPPWKPFDNSVQCLKYGYQNVLFLNSINDNRCMPWTWYIGTEFIFYLLSPIFLLSLRRSPAIGLILATSFISASALANAITIISYNFPPAPMFWKQPKIFSEDYILHHILLYIKPWYRIGPYLVGILLGYCLVDDSNWISKGDLAKKNKIYARCHSTKFIVLGWIASTVAGFWSIYGLYPALQGWDFPVYHVFYGATFRTVFAAALSWLIYACHLGFGGRLNTVLSAALFLPLSTLSYSVYLIHLIPVLLTFLLAPFPLRYTSNRQLYGYCVLQLSISYFFGTVYALIVELPALNIERLLLGYGNGSRRADGYALSPIQNGAKILSNDDQNNNEETAWRQLEHREGLVGKQQFGNRHRQSAMIKQLN